MPWLRSKLGFHLLRVLVMPLDGLPPVKVKHPELAYAALAENQVLEWCKDPQLELDAQRASAACRRGDLCVGVSEQGRPVGYIWFAFDAAPHVQGAWVHFDSCCRYSYKSFIRASHRGKHISQELYTRASEICPRRGSVLGILSIDIDNRRSLEASRRVGRIVVGYAGFVRLFGRMLAFRTPGAARFGFAFGATAEKGARPLAAPPVLRQRAAFPLLKRR